MARHSHVGVEGVACGPRGKVRAGDLRDGGRLVSLALRKLVRTVTRQVRTDALGRAATGAWGVLARGAWGVLRRASGACSRGAPGGCSDGRLGRAPAGRLGVLRLADPRARGRCRRWLHDLNEP